MWHGEFRSEQAVREAVHGAGFSIDQIYGGWEGEPVGSTDGELLVHAHRRAARPAHVARK
jgi:hypothetical protein